MLNTLIFLLEFPIVVLFRNILMIANYLRQNPPNEQQERNDEDTKWDDDPDLYVGAWSQFVPVQVRTTNLYHCSKIFSE